MGFIITDSENKPIAAINFDKDLDVTFVLEEGYKVKETVSERELDLGDKVYIPDIDK